MADIQVPFVSKEPIRVPIRGKESGVPTNPTGFTVETAFTDGSDPSGWVVSVWETDPTTDPDTYFARVVVGGTGSGAPHSLAKGTYTGWARITVSGSERPVIKVENLVEII